MKQNKTILVAAVATLLLSGCDSLDKSGAKDFFPEEGRAINNFCAAKIAAGAKADGTLEPTHFTGNKLNSLGEAKLDAMLKDQSSDDSLTIYMNFVGEDTDLRARRDAVTNYLEDRGVDKDHLELKLGANPNVSTLAAEGIANLAKLEGGGGEDAPKPAAGASGGGSMGSSSESK